MTGNSKMVAKKRLQSMFHERKNQISDELMKQMQEEISEIVSRYVEVEPENIEIKIVLKEKVTKCLNNTN